MVKLPPLDIKNVTNYPSTDGTLSIEDMLIVSIAWLAVDPETTKVLDAYQGFTARVSAEHKLLYDIAWEVRYPQTGKTLGMMWLTHDLKALEVCLTPNTANKKFYFSEPKAATLPKAKGCAVRWLLEVSKVVQQMEATL